jgi:putative flippase GtrA
LVSKHTLKQFVFFSAVGGIGTGGHYLTLVTLVEGKWLSPVPASVAGFIVGALINYVLNYHFTFNSKKSHKEAMSKFFVVALFGAMINTGLMYIGVDVLHAYYLLAQIGATAIVLLWNFIINKYWTFGQGTNL